MRIVFTGHHGLRKSCVVDNFKRYLCESKDIDERCIHCYDLERDYLNSDVHLYLDLDNWTQQFEQWRNALDDICLEIEESDPTPEVILLCLHLSYQWIGHFASPISWFWRPPGRRTRQTLLELLGERFRPDYFVALIDDIQEVQKRIQMQFRLRELMAWRNLEMMLTDLAATELIGKRSTKVRYEQFSFEYSPVVAIRHSPEMLYRLIFESDTRMRVYASFPITRTRERYREQIDDFREALSQEFAVFDPLTIDERPLQEALREHLHLERTAVGDNLLDTTLAANALHGEAIQIPAQAFWPIPAGKTLCGENRGSMQVAADEIREIILRWGAKRALARSVELRDFRLIDQSDCVVVYRPFFHTGRPAGELPRWSGGTREETAYAHRRLKPVFIVHDPAADGPYVADEFDKRFVKAKDLLEYEGLDDKETRRKVLQEVVERVAVESTELIQRRVQSTAAAGPTT